MRAAVVTAPGKIQVMDVEVPEIKSPYDILLKVDTASICNTTDYKIFSAEDPTKVWPFKPHPFILGHECFGTIIEKGAAVKNLEAGDGIVFWTMDNGAFAEYVCVSAEDLAIGKVNGRIPGIVAPIMEMVIGTARMLVNAKNEAYITKGDNVVIYGLGPAGLLFVQLAKAFGTEKVIAVDFQRMRLDKAAELGADVMIDSKKQKAVDVIKEQTGLPDVFIDCTGADILGDVDVLSHRGMRFVPFGVPPFSWDEKMPFFNGRGILFDNTGMPEAKLVVERCIEWVATGIVKLEPLVTHQLPLEHIEYGMKFCHDFRDETLKVIIKI